KGAATTIGIRNASSGTAIRASPNPSVARIKVATKMTASTYSVNKSNIFGPHSEPQLREARRHPQALQRLCEPVRETSCPHLISSFVAHSEAMTVRGRTKNDRVVLDKATRVCGRH